MSTSNTSNKIQEFALIYTKSFFEEGVGANKITISYDSKRKEVQLDKNLVTTRLDPNTNQLKSTDHPSISKKRLTASEENKLAESIRAINFFELKTDYPITVQGPHLVSLSLKITMNGQVHTVSWTDRSLNAPAGLKNIADLIEKFAGI